MLLTTTLFLIVVAGARAADLSVSTEEEIADEIGNSLMRNLRRQTSITRIPCNCNPATESCSCCGRYDQTAPNFHSSGCATVRWGGGRRNNRMLRYEFTMNNRTVARNQPSGRDPQMMCQPFPRYPYTDVCSRFYRTSWEDNGDLNFCVSMDGRWSGWPFYTMNWDCVSYNTNSNQAWEQPRESRKRKS